MPPDDEDLAILELKQAGLHATYFPVEGMIMVFLPNHLSIDWVFYRSRREAVNALRAAGMLEPEQ